MNTSHRAHKLAIVGQSGTGKTTYLVRWLLRTRARSRFIWDPEAEIAPKCGQTSVTDRKLLVNSALKAGWACYDPAVECGGNLAGGFEWFAETVWRASTLYGGRKLFVVDEAQRWIPAARPMPPAAAFLLDTGRRYELDVALVSQAPQRIHGDARNQLTELVCFRLADVNARRWATDLGLSRDPGTLRPGQYIARNLESGVEVTGKVF